MPLNLPNIDDSIGFDMTPMIDIVFQLILFFMLAMDMSQHEVEAVVLPTASEATEDKDPDKERVIVNVCHEDIACPTYDGGRICRDKGHWVIKLRSKTLSLNALGEELFRYAQSMMDADDANVSNRPVMIRADERAPFAQVQRVLREANKQKMWKIEIGAKQPVPE